jgi:hypothetical protein
VNGQDAYSGQLVPVQVTTSAGRELGDIAQTLLRYYGQGSDLDTQSWVVQESQSGPHIQNTAGTLRSGKNNFQAVVHERWAGSAQRADQAAPLLHGGEGIRTTDIDGATWVIEQDTNG